MKRLHLLRHAKSSWADASLTDHQRPLKRRGYKDARLMAPAMHRLGWQPSSVHCSSARRARETIAEVFDALEFDLAGIAYHDALYTFSGVELQRWLQRASGAELTLVGHNPALHELYDYLSGESLPRYPTAAYCCLDLDIDHWAELDASCATQVAFLTPRELKDSH